MVENGSATCANPELTQQIVSLAYSCGLILLSCGINGNVIRFLPPLTIEMELVEEGLDILDKCFESLRN